MNKTIEKIYEQLDKLNKIAYECRAVDYLTVQEITNKINELLKNKIILDENIVKEHIIFSTESSKLGDNFIASFNCNCMITPTKFRPFGGDFDLTKDILTTRLLRDLNYRYDDVKQEEKKDE